MEHTSKYDICNPVKSHVPKCIDVEYGDSYPNSSSDFIDSSSVKSLTESKKTSKRRNTLMICIAVLIILTIGAAIGIGIWRGVKNSKHHDFKKSDCTSSEDFRCSDGLCIRMSQLCDRTLDCLDGEDESELICSGDQVAATVTGTTRGFHRPTSTPTSSTPTSSTATSSTPTTSTPTSSVPTSSIPTNNFPTSSTPTSSTPTSSTSTSSIPTSSIPTTSTPTSSVTTSATPLTNSPTVPPTDASTELHKSSPLPTDGSTEPHTSSPLPTDGYVSFLTFIAPPATTSTPQTSTPACASYFFVCSGDSNCVPWEKVCDGYWDCSKGQDEHWPACPTCIGSFFQCSDGSCICMDKVCDLVYDCSNGEDEHNGNCIWSTDAPNTATYRPTASAYPNSEGSTTARPTSRTTVCSNSYFQCNNGRFIPMNKRCDGVFDCAYNEDEYNCLYSSTTSSRPTTSSQSLSTTITDCLGPVFLCGDGVTCFTWDRVCDGYWDCPEGKDELWPVCPTPAPTWSTKTATVTPVSRRTAASVFSCPVNYFRCSSYTCIPTSYLCDGVAQCTLGEDESLSICGNECFAGEFRCHDGECIKAGLVCDGYSDCTKGEDESSRYCFSLIATTTLVPAGGSCGVSQFLCRDSSCIPSSWICDGTPDCLFGEDERHGVCGDCPKYKFRCSDGFCISTSWVCDRYPDCSAGEDENAKYCGNYSSMTSTAAITEAPTISTTYSSGCNFGQFSCTSELKCISVTWLCDGDKDCIGGEDEMPMYCNGTCRFGLWQCPESGSCIHSRKVCDNNCDCSQCNDEGSFCAFTTTTSTPTTSTPSHCSENQFRCYAGNCILKNLVCNGVEDCRDGDDEDYIICSDWPGAPEPTAPQVGYGGCHWPYSYSCINTHHFQCISSDKLCDGIKDCAMGGEDEDADTCFRYSKFPVTTTTPRPTTVTPELTSTSAPMPWTPMQSSTTTVTSEATHLISTSTPMAEPTIELRTTTTTPGTTVEMNPTETAD